MGLEIKTSLQVRKDFYTSYDSDENIFTEYSKEWVSVESLKQFIINDRRDKFREACLDGTGKVKSTITKLLEKLENGN